MRKTETGSRGGRRPFDWVVRFGVGMLMPVVALVLLINGCARLFPGPQGDAAAVAMVSRLTNNNAGLDQFKGIMRVRLQTNHRDLAGRAAWAADAPNQLRVELLNMLGQPVTSLAANGRQMTILTRPESKSYRLQQTRASLEPLIDIPVGVDDLIHLLAGRAPLPEHAAARMVRGKGNGDGDHIVLVNRWHATVAQLYLDQDSGRVRMLKVFGEQGELHFRIEWLQWQTVETFTVPRQIELYGPENQYALLTLDRYWLATKLPPSTFELTLPESGS